MSLGILNNISALYAQNSLNSTQASLQNTLQQLSSGSRINSGADDAAGLAVADGLHANEAALTQSSQNATAGIGLLQTADGALSQVTNLLDRAVTLATEAANGTLTAGQVSSANQEYQNILTQIGNIGSTTNFNSSSVFTNSVTNIVVTDGTSGGLNTYSDIIGALTMSSVGTNAADAITNSRATPANTAPGPGANIAGQYTLTPAGAADTFNGTMSYTIGTSTTAVQVVIGADSTLSQVATALTTAGLTASVANGVINITGPTSGANAAANTVNFTSNLSDTPPTTPIGGAVGTAADPGTASTGQLIIAGASSGDRFGGSFKLVQGGNSVTVNIAANSDETSVQSQINAQIAPALNKGFVLTYTTGITNPTFNFIGTNNTTPVTITAISLADATTGTATAVGGAGVAGTAAVQGTYALAALGSSSDTYGTGATASIHIGSTPISVAGLTAAGLKQAINSNLSCQADGVSASVNAAGTILTINGKSDGSALNIVGSGGGPVAFTDQAPNAAAITTIAQTQAPNGTLAVGGKSVITLGGATDTLAGTLTVAVNTGGSAKTATLAVAASTSGQGLADQINKSANFAAAGLTAQYDAATFKVTLTGPTGAANTIATDGTSLTNSTSVSPQGGADFTTAQVSTLTSLTATQVLTTVTSAIVDVAYQRGTIGADINELTSASNIASSEGVNLTSAEESIRATNYGQAASDLSKYQILSQTGISALAQANSVQQEVLKLLQ